MDPKIIGEHIKKYRKEKGMTQQQLADALFVSDKTVSRWELGNGFPDISELPRIASLLGISIDTLVGKDGVSSADKAPCGSHVAVDLSEQKHNGKKRAVVVTACVLSVVFALISVGAGIYLSGFFSDATYVFEAENAIFSDAFHIEEVAIASGCKVVGWMHADGSSLTFLFNAQRGTSATLGFVLNRAWSFVFEEKLQLFVNDEEIKVGIVSGVGWDGTDEGKYYAFGDPVEVKANLKRGVNEVKLVVRDGLNMTVDCLRVTASTRITDSRKNYVYEAENATFDCKYSVLTDKNASGKKYVGEWKNVGDNVGNMTFSLQSDRDVYLVMYVYFNHPYTVVFENKFLLTVNGQSVPIGKVAAAKNDSADKLTCFSPPAEVTVFLKRGQNEIRFSVVNGGENFDCIRFVTAVGLK